MLFEVIKNLDTKKASRGKERKTLLEGHIYIPREQNRSRLVVLASPPTPSPPQRSPAESEPEEGKK